MKSRSLAIFSALSAVAAATVPPQKAQPPGTVPREFAKRQKLSPFYQQYVDAGGIPVLGSKQVSDDALREAAKIVREMFSNRKDILHSMSQRGLRVVVEATREFTTDLPEFRDLRPRQYYDVYERSKAATLKVPVMTCGEENLLFQEGDPAIGEIQLVRQLAAAVPEFAMKAIDPTFDTRLSKAWQHALDTGIILGDSTPKSRDEYWAQGVQCWFNASRAAAAGDRDELAQTDPTLADLIAEVFGKSVWTYQPPSEHIPWAGTAFAWPKELLSWKERFERGIETLASPISYTLPLEPARLRPAWKSTKDDTPSDLYLVNASSLTVKVDWMDFEGNPKPLLTLRPGEYTKHSTFAHYVWRFSGADGNLLGYCATLPDRSGQLVIRNPGDPLGEADEGEYEADAPRWTGLISPGARHDWGSSESSVSTMVCLLNESGHRLHIEWLDRAGNTSQSDLLRPDEYVKLSTFAGQAWRVTGEDGTLYGYALAQSRPMVLAISKPVEASTAVISYDKESGSHQR